MATMRTVVRRSTAQGYQDHILILMNPDGLQRIKIVHGLQERGISNAESRVLVAPLMDTQPKISAFQIIRVWFTGNDWEEHFESFKVLTKRGTLEHLVFDPSEDIMLSAVQPMNTTVSGSLPELLNIAAILMSSKVFVP